MATVQLSTIAQLLFTYANMPHFARTVAEVEATVTQLMSQDVRLVWDIDDLVTFKLPRSRVILSWVDLDSRGLGGCLTVSVGPDRPDDPAPSPMDHEALCSTLAEHIRGRFQPHVMLWRQVDGVVEADLLADLVAVLQDVAAGLPAVDSILAGVSQMDLDKAGQRRTTSHASGLSRAELTMNTRRGAKSKVAFLKHHVDTPVVANDQPELPRRQDAAFVRLRDALVAPVNEDTAVYSTQMRLAAHCFNATLILIWMPLGAAVMTYSLLKGEDMRLSARLMAVAGTVFALAHSPVGQTVAAMARGIG